MRLQGNDDLGDLSDLVNGDLDCLAYRLPGRGASFEELTSTK